MRRRRGLIALGLMSGLFLVGMSGVEADAGQVKPPAPVTPHVHNAPDGDDADDADGHDEHEHMLEDLAQTPINVIEKQTRANAVRIQKATGVRPGAARTRAAVAADPGKSGSWSAVVDTPVVPVFQAVLPNGKVLIWDSVGDNAAESYPVHDFTRAMVWNPADNSYKRVDVQGTNIFCSGFAHLSNGNILVAGGNLNAQTQGTVTTYVFDWRTETWTRGPDMAAGRWYPAVAETANGEEVIVGGGPTTAEVYQTDGSIRPLTGFTKYGLRVYPFMGSRPDTQLGFFGPYATGYTISTSGSGVITATGTRDSIAREYGSFATYDIGKTVVVGGGDLTEGGVADVPTRTAVVLDSNAAGFPTVASTGSLSTGRRQLNSTLLADGSVLATGGMSSAATSPLVDLDHAVTAAERWDPATGQWTVLASASRVREYHSTAALLPDGRVMTGGGGVCAICMTDGYLEKNIEYFTPPYLYKKDGTGQLASRPVISTAPAGVGINAGFTVSTPQAGSIRKVALVGLADVTHSIDQGQRYVPLTFSASGTTLSVTGPPNGGVTPPGYYMLFVVDAAGVPSVAKIVQVTEGPAPVMSPLRNATGRCIDVPAGSTAIRTYLWLYTCNGSTAQSLSRLPGDNTVRVLGNCLDVSSGSLVPGQRIWAYRCNGTAAQKWSFKDGTIRPMGNTSLCLAAASPDNKAALQLATCNGYIIQRWVTQPVGRGGGPAVPVPYGRSVPSTARARTR